jgi:hypothetical protein
LRFRVPDSGSMTAQERGASLWRQTEFLTLALAGGARPPVRPPVCRSPNTRGGGLRSAAARRLRLRGARLRTAA